MGIGKDTRTDLPQGEIRGRRPKNHADDLFGRETSAWKFETSSPFLATHPTRMNPSLSLLPLCRPDARFDVRV